MAPLAPHSAAAVAAEAARPAEAPARARTFGDAGLPEAHGKPRPMGQLLSWALADCAAKYPEFVAFGEDVGRKGGVYHVTADLQARVGRGRVFDTLLDETTILGLAMGAGLCGFLPVPEIQYLAYVHNALDQLRGEACSQQYFSNGRYRNPMVVRIAAFAYQEGFGGHFHNDNSVAALRDIPGLVVAAPARGDDAVAMLRTALAAARVDGRVVAFCEPIALYHQKDRYAAGDEGWCFAYPGWGAAVPLGQARVYGTGGEDDARPPGEDRAEAVIVTYANGVRLSLQAVRRSRRRVRIVDLRWLQPLDAETLVAEAHAAGRVLVVDEGRRSGGVAEPVMALLAERAPGVRLARVTGDDTYIPLGDAWKLVLPSVDSIAAGLEALLGK
jgi:2-oxoisovalerate dehydrogenase E1 component